MLNEFQASIEDSTGIDCTTPRHVLIVVACFCILFTFRSFTPSCLDVNNPLKVRIGLLKLVVKGKTKVLKIATPGTDCVDETDDLTWASDSTLCEIDTSKLALRSFQAELKKIQLRSRLGTFFGRIDWY